MIDQVTEKKIQDGKRSGLILDPTLILSCRPGVVFATRPNLVTFVMDDGVREECVFSSVEDMPRDEGDVLGFHIRKRYGERLSTLMHTFGSPGTWTLDFLVDGEKLGEAPVAHGIEFIIRVSRMFSR